MEDLIIRFFNGEEYVLVDTFNPEKKIYYFKNKKNELFCYKIGEIYEIIEDFDLIKKIKEENDLNINSKFIY